MHLGSASEFVKKHRSCLVFLLSMILVFISMIKPLAETDLFWHLRVGEYIFNTHSIPYTDFLSFSMFGYPYVYHSWGAELIMYVFFKLLGLWGISIVFALVTTIGTLFLGLTIRLYTKSSIALLLLPLFSGYFLAVSGLRTQAFTFTLLALLGYLLANKQLSPLTTDQLSFKSLAKRIIIMFLLFLLWVNLHGGFAVGMIVLGIYSAVKLFVSRERVIVLTRSALTMIVVLVATLINPYTYRSLEQAFLMGTNSFARTNNADWLPIQSSEIYSYQTDFIFVLLVSLVLLWFVYKSRKRFIELFWSLIIFTLLLFESRRYMLPLAVLIVPPSLVLIAELLIKNKQKLINRAILPFYVLFGLIIGASTLVNLDGAAYVNADMLRYGSFSKYTTLPAGAFVYLQQNGVPQRMLNEGVWGGHLEWFFPNNLFFIDGRMDNFFIDGQSFLSVFHTIVHKLDGWEELFNQYDFDGVLLRPGREIVRELLETDRWYVAFEDDDAILLLRR